MFLKKSDNSCVPDNKFQQTKKKLLLFFVENFLYPIDSSKFGRNLDSKFSVQILVYRKNSKISQKVLKFRTLFFQSLHY